MNFFEETSDTICTSAYVYKQSDFIDEVVLIPKSLKKEVYLENYSIYSVANCILL